MRDKATSFCLALLLVSTPGGANQGPGCGNRLRLNQIQVIGSHNSYHAGMGSHEMELLRLRNPKAAEALSYAHPPLDIQLNRGIRQIELDIYADSTGGRYSHPAWPRMMAAAKMPLDPDFDPQHLFDRPGFKVMHVQDLDYRSNCQPFVECLGIVRRWSHAHPGHLPIFILIETKESKERDYMTPPEPFTPEVFDALDAELLSVFPMTEIITPDQIRGHHSTLEQAVLSDGWPCLEQSRGKVIFLMDQRKAGPAYLKGHPALRNRIIFTNAEPGEPDAAFVEVNDPLADRHAIPELIKKGYIVRTRADADLHEAMNNDTRMRDAALASGAQMISTDFPFTEKAPTGYAVRFPEEGVSRCNPMTAFAECNSAALESSPAGSANAK
ncbi:MAG TPA: phosphatidylinositol-specific phospholipase C1-like protein [Terriglobales bacterium]